jgi:hypothetical protein
VEVLCFLPSAHYPLYDFDLRATHARTLLPAALASVSFGFVLVRVRVRKANTPRRICLIFWRKYVRCFIVGTRHDSNATQQCKVESAKCQTSKTSKKQEVIRWVSYFLTQIVLGFNPVSTTVWRDRSSIALLTSHLLSLRQPATARPRLRWTHSCLALLRLRFVWSWQPLSFSFEDQAMG